MNFFGGSSGQGSLVENRNLHAKKVIKEKLISAIKELQANQALAQGQQLTIVINFFCHFDKDDMWKFTHYVFVKDYIA